MRIRYVLFQIFLLIFSSAFSFSQNTSRGFKETVQSEQQEEISVGKYYALLIANQDYLDKKFDKLEEPIKDAEKIKSVLVSSYNFANENITLLKNPKRSEIFMAFQTIEEAVTENDNLIVFYAGHGKYDTKKNQGYWFPADSKIKIPSDWISNSDIRDMLKGIKAKHILLISDACFSGGIFKTRSVNEDADKNIKALDQLPSRRAMTSGALGVVQDVSVFVEYLVKRLTENKEKYLNAQKLFVSFQDAVINNSQNSQTPQYGIINEVGDEGGDFIFYRPSILKELPKITSLTISSSVSDAEVYIDGKIIGKANPFLKHDDIKAGLRQLEVRKKGFTPYKNGIMIADKNDNKIDITLEALKIGNLIVKSNVSANVFLNDKVTGSVDGEKTFLDINYGEYEVKLQKTGYKTYAAKVSINENRDYVIDATLKPYSATLKLNGNIFGKVFVDGEYYGNAPLEKFEIPVGKKTILVSKAGYGDFEREVDFVADKSYAVPYTLTPLTVGSAIFRSSLLPGSGQRYQNRSTMGFLYSGAFIGSVGALVKMQLDYSDRVSNYNSYADKYINEKNPSLIPLRKATMLSAEKSKTNAEELRNYAALGVIGVYLLNLLDVVIFEPTYNDDISISLDRQRSTSEPLITASIRF